MKLGNSKQVDIAFVWVPEGRQRARGFDTSDIEPSIKKRGVLQPILIKKDGELVFGERRLTASRNLGLTKIPARVADDLSPSETKIIELIENFHRKDIDWKDQAKAVSDIHGIFCTEDSGWTQAETGEEIGMKQGTVSMYLAVHAEMANPRVAEAGTAREALNVIARRDQRAAGAALDDLLSAPDVVEESPRLSESQIDSIHVPAEVRAGLTVSQPKLRIVGEPEQAKPSAPESIIHGSFLDWAPTYSGPKFNFAHCDFPYGVNLGSGPQGRGAEEAIYLDTPEVYWQLLQCFCQNLDNFLSASAHIMFWLSADIDTVFATKQFFAKHAPSIAFCKFPLIWSKSDNAGISSNARTQPRHTYEACLLGSRSGRNIVQIKADSYQSQSDRSLHPSTKPEPMLRHFMEMLVDDHTALLDPTCGSGASLRAAESLGAKRVLGLEIDEKYVEPARRELKLFRAKAVAASR